MKTLSSVTTRRDRCYLFGRRALRLNRRQAVTAWYAFSQKLEAMGDLDVPKFNDLLSAVRVCTVLSKKQP